MHSLLFDADTKRTTRCRRGHTRQQTDLMYGLVYKQGMGQAPPCAVGLPGTFKRHTAGASATSRPEAMRVLR
jgi:hypothetical protein